MILSGTGHRFQNVQTRPHFKACSCDEASAYDRLTSLLIKYLLIHKKELVSVNTGMALFFDMALGESSYFLDIPFDAIVPFNGQEDRWHSFWQEKYDFLLSKARKVIVLDEDYSPENKKYLLPDNISGQYNTKKLFLRNEYLVDHCDRLVSLFNGAKAGGTWGAIRYAELHRPYVKIDNLWDSWVKHSGFYEQQN